MLDLSAIIPAFGDIIRDLTRGVPFHVVDVAPETYPQLFVENHGNLPILGLYCDGTIFGDPHVNRLARLFHDRTHLALGALTDPEGELRVTREQCRVVGQRSQVLADMLYADLYGQTEHMVAFNEFPADQLAFTLHYAATGGEVLHF